MKFTSNSSKYFLKLEINKKSVILAPKSSLRTNKIHKLIKYLGFVVVNHKNFKNIYLKINNQNLTNLENFWHQTTGSEKEEKRAQDYKKWLRNEWKTLRSINGRSSQLWEGKFWWREEEDDQACAWSSILTKIVIPIFRSTTWNHLTIKW